LRRLERLGLLGGEQQHVCEARAVFVAGRGATVLGVGRRRAPRPAVQREHELAIVALVVDLERRRTDLRVLSERECRRRERAGLGAFSVEGAGGRGDRRHWPDAVIELPWGVRVAVEVELSAKAPERLSRVIEAHVAGSPYSAVHYLVAEPALARRLRALGNETAERFAWMADERTELVVEPLPAAPVHLADRIYAAAHGLRGTESPPRMGTDATSSG
jgi:hypothetical protein